jgi:hypothetical protein
MRFVRGTLESIPGGVLVGGILVGFRHHLDLGIPLAFVGAILGLVVYAAIERCLKRWRRFLKGFVVIHDPSDNPGCVQERRVSTHRDSAASAGSSGGSPVAFTEVYLRVKVSTRVPLHDVGVAIRRDAVTNSGPLEKMGTRLATTPLHPDSPDYFDVAYAWIGQSTAGITYVEESSFSKRTNFPVLPWERVSFRATGRTEDDRLVSSKPVEYVLTYSDSQISLAKP